MFEDGLAPEDAERRYYAFLLENHNALLERHASEEFDLGAGGTSSLPDEILQDIIRSTEAVPNLKIDSLSKTRLLIERIVVFATRLRDETRTRQAVAGVPRGHD